MQAIITKYHGPTNNRGARISAKCDAKRIYVPYNHHLDASKNHLEAARKLAELLLWDGEWIGGAVEHGYVFVCNHAAGTFIVEEK